MKVINKKIYLAGPLFSRGDLANRFYDEELLLELLDQWDRDCNRDPNIKIKLDIFNPIKFNKTLKLTNDLKKDNATIFKKDYYEMSKSDIIIADLDYMDAGTLLELGIFIGWKRQLPNLKVYTLFTNWRGEHVVNKFIAGALDQFSNHFTSIHELMTAVVKDIVKEVNGDFTWKN